MNHNRGVVDARVTVATFLLAHIHSRRFIPRKCNGANAYSVRLILRALLHLVIHFVRAECYIGLATDSKVTPTEKDYVRRQIYLLLLLRSRILLALPPRLTRPLVS